jgi:glyoxylase-like metal-dependent hydrolase (beta-lactamase superfamily II)
MRLMRLLALVAVAWAATVATPLLAQRPAFAPPDPARDEVQVLHVKDQVWMIGGAGGNIAVQVGIDGLFLVDAGLEAFSGQVLEALSELSDGPVRMIVNTRTARDHIGGNAVVAETGEPLYLSQNSGGVTFPVAQIVGHEAAAFALARRTGADAVPQALWPFDTFYADLKTVFANEEPIEIHHLAAAIDEGNTMVFFRRSDVIAAGDVYDTRRYPQWDPAEGGSLQGVIDALNQIIRIAIPGVNQMGGTRIIPGHGRISNESDVVEYRDMASIVRDRVRTLAEGGATLDDVRAAGVTRDYDGIYGWDTGPWTIDMFIEAVYREVAAP